MRLLIIGKRFILEKFHFRKPTNTAEKIRSVCNRTLYRNSCSYLHSEIMIDVSAARVQSVLMNDWCWSTLPLFIEALLQSFTSDVLGQRSAISSEIKLYFTLVYNLIFARLLILPQTKINSPEAWMPLMPPHYALQTQDCKNV